MNDDFPALQLTQPEKIGRRNEKPRPVPTDPAIIAARRELANRARAVIAAASVRLTRLTEEQRRAVFLKIEHEGTLDLSGTGLKAIATGDGNFTLAIPTADDLAKYLAKVDKFETEAPRRLGTAGDAQMIPNVRQVASLKDIQEGRPADRVSNGLLAQYDALIASNSVTVEIEIASYVVGVRKQAEEIEEHYRALVTLLGGGQHGRIFEHEDIEGTRRVVLQCTGQVFRTLVEAPEWQLAVAWFEERPRFQTFFEIEEQFSADSLGEITAPSLDASIVCVIDSGASVANPFLAPVMRQDLMRSYVLGQENDPSDHHGHGSGMASLAAYFALQLANGAENHGKVWIASARILDRHNRVEDRLFSKVVGEAIRHFVDRGVRIFNLSVNIDNRTWTQDEKRTVPHSSWVARSLDKLVRELDIVLVVSAGNLMLQDVNRFIADNIQYPRYLGHEDCALLDPAQSALSLSVGSEVVTATIAGDVHARALAAIGSPSPITRVGPGIAGETKPELVELDGNLAFNEDMSRARHLRSLQIPQASNSIAPALNWAIGTSSAAARVSHKAALVLEDLVAMGIERPSSPLIKAFLVNSAARSAQSVRALADLDETWPEGEGVRTNATGYGVADARRATWCDDYCVIMWYDGSIAADEIAFFQVPVPSEFIGTNGRKRLTVTVVHHSVVQQRGFGAYLGMGIKWRMFRGDIPKETVIEEMSVDDAGDTTPGDLPDELPFEPRITARSKGSVQHAVLSWTQHRPEFADNHYTLAIAARKRWQRTVPACDFAVVIRLEDEARTTEVYSRVEAALVELQVEAGA